MSELFREEAVRHATRRLAGEVMLAASLRGLVLTALAVVTVAGGLIFATTATYARKETVLGWVAPQAGLIRLAARQGGVVSALQVREGQALSEGQTVATLTLSSEIEGGDSLAAFSRSLDAQVSAAEAAASARLAALSAEQGQLRARRIALAREREETRSALKLQEERLTLARSEVERAQAIADQGFLPRRELEARRSAELAARQETSTLSGRILSFDREIGEADARLSATPIDAAAAAAAPASGCPRGHVAQGHWISVRRRRSARAGWPGPAGGVGRIPGDYGRVRGRQDHAPETHAGPPCADRGGHPAGRSARQPGPLEGLA